MTLDYIKCGDSKDLLKDLPDASIDMVLTSPPYDDLRTYNGYSWDFEAIAKELYRVLKDGGVIVWIVADATIDGSESGSSFRQALYFQEIGFNIHDTMIWDKNSFTATGALVSRYGQVFEYMFVFSKGKPKSFNPIKDRRSKYGGSVSHGTVRKPDGSMRPRSTEGKMLAEYGQRYNIWRCNPVHSKFERVGHPAPFPEELCRDHIISWSNKGDIVLDPFMGGGTTAIACIDTQRHYIGFEISQEYCDIAEERISVHKSQLTFMDILDVENIRRCTKTTEEQDDECI